MRIATVCVASSLAAIGSAVVVLAPADAADREPAASAALVAPASAGHPTGPALPPVPVPPTPLRSAPEASFVARSADPSAQRQAADAAVIERLRAELGEARARLEAAERRVTLLVQSHCWERFDVELDRWLDGPLGTLHADDVPIRYRLREALVATAEQHGRELSWDPELQEWYPGECPEEVASLRSRFPAALVAQLAELYRGWERETSSRPRVDSGNGGWCGNSRPRMVTVVEDGRETVYLREHPYVQSLLDERERIDRHWQLRINTLLDAELYELE